MQSDMYEQYDEFDMPKPKPFATVLNRTLGQPNLKFQTAGHAKQSIRGCINTYGTNKFSKHFTVYKLQDEKYVKIFESNSHLGRLFATGQLTYEQLIARIFA